MSRLFTFGCSFTQYMWPTWADIVAYDMGIEYHNFAIAGLGNVGIQHRILEADIKHNFQKDDIILILWTSWCREDRVKNNQWNACGSVLNPDNGQYDRSFVKKYWDYSNDIVKNSTAIITTNRLYENNIRWQAQGSPFFMLEYDTIKQSNEKALIKLYKKHLPKIDKISTFADQDEPLAFKFVNDCHPDVKKHLSYVEDNIYIKLNLTLKASTKLRFLELQKDIEDKLFKKTDFTAARTIVEDLLHNKFRDIFQVMNFKSLID
jgi:hypothetical protein